MSSDLLHPAAMREMEARLGRSAVLMSGFSEDVRRASQGGAPAKVWLAWDFDFRGRGIHMSLVSRKLDGDFIRVFVPAFSLGDVGSPEFLESPDLPAMIAANIHRLARAMFPNISVQSIFAGCENPYGVHDGLYCDILWREGGQWVCEGCDAIRMQKADRKRARSRMSKSRRFKVLRRDDFRCKACGSTADDADLEVDHILPVSKGGRSDLSNLQTLCFDCNQGKAHHRVPEMEPDGGIPISEMPRHWRYRFKGGDYWYCKTHNEVSGVPF